MNTRERLAIGLYMIAILVGLALMLLAGGCSVQRPQVRLELEHVSHPLAGWPFGPSTEEDALTQANVMLEWERGRVRVEQGLGYRLMDQGFYGPELTYTGRVSVRIGRE